MTAARIPVRLAILVLAVVLGSPAAGAGTASAAAEPPLAPPLVARTLDGEKLDLDHLRREGPVVLDFWATWCRPCIEAVPELKAMRERLAPLGVSVVGISVDGPRGFAKVRPFVTRLGIDYPVVVDTDGRLQDSYVVRGVPTTVVVRPDGRIASVHTGYRPGDFARLEREIRDLLPAAMATDTSGVADTTATPR